MPSLFGYIESEGEYPKHLTFLPAALMAFYIGAQMAEGGKRMKNKLMKSIMAASLAAVMAFTAAGCGSGGDSAANNNADNTQKEEQPLDDVQKEEQPSDDAQKEEQPSDSGDQASGSGDYEECTLTLSWWGGDTTHNATLEAIKAFEAAYPGIKVESAYASWDGWEEKMAIAFVAGTAQDVNQVNWNWITQYDGDGTTFLDLNDYADVIDMTQIDNAYLEMCQIAGTQAAVPISMTGRIFYWDKTSFDEAGIGVPASYAELLAAGKAFQEHGEDYYPLVLDAYDRMILMVYYLESKYGDDWVKDNTVQYDQAKVEEGLAFLKEMEDNHVIPKLEKLIGDGAGSLDQNQNWIDGHYAGVFEWDSSADRFETALAQGREPMSFS